MPLKIGTEMPSLEGATEWLDGTATPTAPEITGHPTLVHFWSVNCEICKRNLPRLAGWRDTLRDEGLRVLAVHLPRFASETDTEIVRATMATCKITEPCAVDNEHLLRTAFQNDECYVPAYYLFDADGKLRSYAMGERGLDIVAPVLERVLEGVGVAEPTHAPPVTPFCSKCQIDLEEDSLFCSHCGRPVVIAHDPAPVSETHLPQVDKRAQSAPPAPDPPPDPLTGTVLDGKYELLGCLGGGGMSVVYRARRIHIGDEVAVKILLQEFVKEPEAVERFRREARAAAMLRHPNVVTIHDFGETRNADTPAYIVMELVEGASLRDIVTREGRLEIPRAIALMRDICAGVGAAHRRGVVHRDLKPDNIIVVPPDDMDERETAKVVDFGIAKLRDGRAGFDLTQTGMLIGTPYYMSPEQCLGEPLDARSDVYSLGIMLYVMLAGQPPFNSETLTGMIAKHLYEPPPPLPSLLAAPSALEAVLRRALAKDANDRQGNALELGRELQTVPQQRSRGAT